MKKVLILILAVVLSFSVFAMVACNTCETHVDANHDGICDVCEAEGVTYEHIDANHDGKCDACSVSGLTVSHVDANSDGICDVCQNKEAWVTALADAKTYVDTLYLNESLNTIESFDLVTVVAIGTDKFNVTWTLTSEVEGQTAAVLGAVDAETKLQPVTVVYNMDDSIADVPYTLTGTIADATGHSVVVVYERQVPKFKTATWEEYVAACAANDAEAVINVRGYITAVNADKNSSSKGSIWFRDAEGHGYYAYKPSLDSSITASRESILAAFPVGAEVIVSGTVGNSYGNQHNAGCTIKLTGNQAPEGWNAVVDQTEAFSNASGMGDSANLDQYYGSMVTLKGVTMGEHVDGHVGNYYFTVNGKQYIFYMNVYLMDEEAAKATAAKWVVGGKANITGLVTTYSKNFQIYPYGPDCLEIIKEDLTDAEIVDRATSALTLDFDTITAAGESALPTSVKGYDATIAWALDKTYDIASISEGKLVVSALPSEQTTIKLVATITKGAESDTKEIEIKVESSKIDWKDTAFALDLIDTLADGATTEEFYYFYGTVGEIYNTEYCNFYLLDKDGNSIVVYGLYAPNGTDRYGSKRQIAEIPFAEGDLICMRAQVQKYKDKNGNITPELVNAVEIVTPAKGTEFFVGYSATEALAICNALADGATTEEYSYFMGVVGEIYNTEYCNFYLTDANGGSIIVYGLYAPNGTDRYGSKRQIAEIPFAEGDIIYIRSQVQKYKDKNGNITPELVNAVLVSFYTPAAVIPDDVIVNVSDLTAGDITESKELATGITLLATADKKVTVESNGKKIECFDFTQRLKLNGTMGSDYRAIKLEVSAPCKIVVYAIAGSSSATDRNLVLNDSTATLVKSINVLGDKLYKVEYEITAAGTYYLGSDNSSINLYYIGIYYGETLAHECDRKCHCGGCLVADCTDEACATKCPGHENHTTIEAALAGAKNDTVEISGTVSKIDYAWSDSSKTMSFYISDGTKEILVYKSTTKVGLGDVVSVEGVIGVFNSKNQIAAGSTVTVTTAHVCSEWNAATCEDAELCKVCGEAKEGSVALGHTYASGVCSVCGAIEGASKVTYTFGSYTAGVQYAEETHTLDANTTLKINKCHLTSELRIYSSGSNDGVAIIESKGVIKGVSFNAGNKVDVLNVYGSVDGTTWTLIQGVSITATSYNDYTVDFSGVTAEYKYIKLDVAGSNQVRLKSLTLVYIPVAAAE